MPLQQLMGFEEVRFVSDGQSFGLIRPEARRRSEFCQTQATAYVLQDTIPPHATIVLRSFSHSWDDSYLYPCFLKSSTDKMSLTPSFLIALIETEEHPLCTMLWEGKIGRWG